MCICISLCVCVCVCLHFSFITFFSTPVADPDIPFRGGGLMK